MIPNIIRTIFLALGLFMLWLGFLYHYELGIREKLPEEAIISTEKQDALPVRELATYTLSNDAYSAEAVKELEFNNLDSKENTLIYRLGEYQESDQMPETINTAGFATEFDLLEEETKAEKQDPARSLPALLSGGGILFLLIGFLAFRLK